MTFLSFAQNISAVPQDLPRRYQRALATDQQPSWSLLEAGWPSIASSCASGLLCNQAVQTLLPFTLINSEHCFPNNKEGRTSRVRALLASDTNRSFLQGTIFKFCINLLEKGSFCCLQMCKLPLQRSTAQDSKI